jgi:hypothetical protein
LRDYGKVHASFWSSATIQALSEDARVLALYLMTSPHSTIAGVFRLPDGYICEDMRWTAERVAKGFAELSRNGFANRCETTKWVWVVKHLEWNPPENPNQRKSAIKVCQSVPVECEWKSEFERVAAKLLTNLEPKAENPSTTVPQPFANQEQKQEQKQKGSAKALQVTLPDGFGVSERVWAWSREKGYPASDVERQLENFLSYAKRKGPKYIDWDEALMAAIREDWAKVRGKSGGADDWTGSAK